MAVLLWEGPSKINGQTIGVLASLSSDNRKTGDSVQIWILGRDWKPSNAQHSGRDEAICGDCVLRPSLKRKQPPEEKEKRCYVTVFYGPDAIWEAWMDGRLQYASIDDIKKIAWKNGLIRFGAYGDPALIPMPLFERLAKGVPHTGYTRQWRQPWAQEYKKYLMASAHSREEALEASAAGWRYFRTRSSKDEKMPREAVCPAAVEAGELINCNHCHVCCGTSKGFKSNIVIDLHGRNGAFKEK